MKPPRNFNSHHVFWEGRQFRRNLLTYKLRQHQGMIIPMNLFDHRDIHHDLMPTPMPKLDAVEHFVNGGVLLPYEEGQPRTRSLVQAIQFFADTGNLATAEHLNEQREYIMRTPMIGEAGVI